MGQSSVKPEGYLPRIVDEQVERYLRIFGAVEIEGTKWCGKTWTARQHGASISYVDEQLALAQDDPSLMLLGEKPHIIDDGNVSPPSGTSCVTASTRLGACAAAGFSPDRRRRRIGRATPRRPKRHSGAGRIGRIKMSPMTLSESGDSENIVSLARLFEEPPAAAIVEDDTQRLVELAWQGRLARSARPGRPGCADDSSRVSDRRMP